MNIRVFSVISFLVMVASCITDDSNKKTAGGPIAPGKENVKPVDSASFTTIQWYDSVRNMGSVSEGQKVEVLFRFKNTGAKPLVIESAKPSCGCTIASKPEAPIMPGQEGEISASFNSEGRLGTNHKTINVTANTKPRQSHVLEFNVQVLGKTEGPKAVSGEPQKF